MITRFNVGIVTRACALAIASLALTFIPTRIKASDSLMAPDTPALAPSPSPSASPTPIPTDRFSVHIQVTNTQLYHGAFPAAYTGPQSLSPFADTAKTFDTTVYLGARLWKGAAAYIDPEFDQGYGPNNTYGVAGYVSGEAYKVGAPRVYGRLHRYYLTQAFNFGGGTQAVNSDQNQLGGSIDTNHLTLYFGKFSVVDLFDNNPYAHDPRNDFMNWSIVDMGAFDYAADAWGYTRGLAAELGGSRSTVRVGIFQLSTVPNTTAISPQFLRQYSPVIEFEQRTSLFGGHPGSIKALVYGNDGYFGSYADALAAAAGTGNPPSTAAVRNSKHWEIGGGLNIAQEVAPHIGVFTRLSATNGTYEADDFTEIDRSISGGVSIDGALFHRPHDAIGVATVVNTLSAPAQQYFAAGGLGIIIGDGGLSYGGEHITEAYYKLGLTKYTSVTGDYQRIINPAYNMARGPVSIYGVRLHAQI